MRLFSGAVRSTPLPWLPVLTNIEPPALRLRAATDKLITQASQTSVVTAESFSDRPGPL